MTDDKKKDDLTEQVSSEDLIDIYDEYDEDEDFSDLGLDDDPDVTKQSFSDSDLDFIDSELDEVYADAEDDQADEAFNDGEDQPKKKSSFKTALLLLIPVIGGVGLYSAGILPGVSTQPTRGYEIQPAAQMPVADQSEDNFVEIEQDDAASQKINLTETQDQNALPEMVEDEDASLILEKASEDISEVFGFAEEETQQEPAEQIPSIDDDILDFAAVDDNAEAAVASIDSNVINNDISADFADVDKRIIDLEQSFLSLQDDISTQLSKLTAMSSSSDAGKAAAAVSTQELNELKRSIEAMSERIDDLEGNISETQEMAQNAMSVAEQKTGAATTGKPSAPVAKKEVKKQSSTVAPKKEAVKKAAAPKKASSGVRASSWQIRAIQVGQAVIAKKNGSETRTINIGDSVPGLGTVKDINYKDGGWIIQGSAGAIKQ